MRVPVLKKKILKKIARSYIKPRPKSSERKKSLGRSYFRRYFFPRGHVLYKRTVAFNPYRKLNYQVENTILMNLSQDLKNQEINKMLNARWLLRSSYKPLSERSFSFGKVYLTHRRRNLFITISTLFEDSIQTGERVIYKGSCGLLAYRGPKRATLHAKTGVLKVASSFLSKKEFTFVDLVFSSGVSRMFLRVLKGLFNYSLYVRYMIIPKRRAHGLSRRKKKRRL